MQVQFIAFISVLTSNHLYFLVIIMASSGFHHLNLQVLMATGLTMVKTTTTLDLRGVETSHCRVKEKTIIQYF